MSVQTKFKMKGSKTGGIYSGKYMFKLCYFLEGSDNIYCKLFNIKKRNKHHHYLCLANGVYNIETEKFEITHIIKGWNPNRCKRILQIFLDEYDWEL